MYMLNYVTAGKLGASRSIPVRHSRHWRKSCTYGDSCAAEDRKNIFFLFDKVCNKFIRTCLRFNSELNQFSKTNYNDTMQLPALKLGNALLNEYYSNGTNSGALPRTPTPKTI